ncbi:MAG: hypothetical protein DRP70_04100 [Spirochaetes bacterium]|nr:MAG: hypothetical protein DRP49_00175 [Spirochaetota bacterium]RKX89315.1 MAG: hypothetical protein DRP70_04100 [Spirochaetota bacterium]
MNKCGNRIRFAVLLTLLLVATAGVNAESQWDITLNVPYYAGLKSSTGDIGDFSQYMFLIPDVKWNYYFGPEWLHFGVGLRLWSLVLESSIYPILSLESNLGNFVINANIGGGLILFFGLANDFLADAVFIPEVSVAYRLGKKKRFSIGTGALFIVAPNVVGLENSSAFVGTAFARWTF